MSMNIFEMLKSYATQYQEVARRGFNAEELAEVKSAKVVASQYGMSVCFFMTAGCQKYIPVSRDSACVIGDAVDLSTAQLLTLEKDGETITRVEVITRY